MNYPNGYDPTMSAAVIQNSVQPLSHAQAQAAHVQAQAQQAQAQAHAQAQAQAQALAQINAQSAFRPPLPAGTVAGGGGGPAPPAHRLVQGGPPHPQGYLGQQQQQHQRHHQQQLPPSSSSQQLPPTWPASFPPPQPFYEASSPGLRPQQLPEQHLQGQAQPPLPQQQHHHRPSHAGSISHSGHDANVLGIPPAQQGNEHAQMMPQHRPSYGGHPSGGMSYGGVAMPTSGPSTTMYPAAPPQMTVHQSPYAGAPPPAAYARASPVSSGAKNNTYSPKQLSTRPPSIHGASPGPPAHQPYPTQGPHQPPRHMSTPGPVQPPGLPISQQQASQQASQQHQHQHQHQQPLQPQPQQPPTPGYLQHPQQSQRPSIVGGLPPQASASGGRLSVQPPLSPTSRERERERVSLLLLINGELLRELLRLQGEGKSGPAGQSPNQGPSPKASDAGDERDGGGGGGGMDGSASPTKPTATHPDWVECLRNLQANLAYLAAVADRAHKPASTVPPSPSILTAPRNLPGLAELYGRLAALFPGVNPFDPPLAPQPARSGGGGGAGGGGGSGGGGSPTGEMEMRTMEGASGEEAAVASRLAQARQTHVLSQSMPQGYVSRDGSEQLNGWG